MQAVKTKEEQIEVRGALVHNLKNISVSLPIKRPGARTLLSASPVPPAKEGVANTFFR
jgi:excinuclease UvrABC ATPase subunit